MNAAIIIGGSPFTSPEPVHKGLRRNGQKPVSTPEVTKSAFTPITRSPAQKSVCKDLIRNGQSTVITFKATGPPLRP
ncbi:Alpha-galactosidase [Lacticaseibacillus rhamnosus LOCK900]|nr:Alpha-galactosidase [Lacticaseibacillus rhamnosus LOCK900]ARD32680.1 hypothetical protein BVH57_09835 [Lacticaseibacillus rhamnosus]EHJ31952.1 hypothetical protein HMPREF0541_01286 [Lacticaseibacillus rhamnosus ATCC 21052]OXT00963.1 hypothetical protein B7G86_11175 [Lacticaseibacillus rhamnosus]PCL25601.1 hypothetical protein CPZ15_09390 [Lacticaseibacillus rhamnosus]